MKPVVVLITRQLAQDQGRLILGCAGMNPESLSLFQAVEINSEWIF